jgi:hypothetical protein
MAATSQKYYAIQYHPEISITHSGEVFYKVKSIKQSKSPIAGGISLTKTQYQDWVNSFTPFYYINDNKFKFRDAYLDFEGKSESDQIQLQSRIESSVMRYWGLYKDYEMVGNEEKAEELKTLLLSAYSQLTNEGKKSFIVERMMYLKQKINVLSDLEQDTDDLQTEYDGLIDDYNSLLTT